MRDKNVRLPTMVAEGGCEIVGVDIDFNDLFGHMHVNIYEIDMFMT